MKCGQGRPTNNPLAVGNVINKGSILMTQMPGRRSRSARFLFKLAQWFERRANCKMGIRPISGGLSVDGKIDIR